MSMESREGCRGQAGLGFAPALSAQELESPSGAFPCGWQDQQKQQEAGAVSGGSAEELLAAGWIVQC